MRDDRVRRLALVLLAVSILLVGCGRGDGGAGREAHPGPTPVALDSVRLAEADSLYLGNPYALAVDPYDGSFYVSDFFADRVLRFARDGSLVRTYGRPGSGPGEFRTPTLVFVVDESTVAAADNEQALIHLFDRGSGVLVRSVKYQGRLGSTVPIALGSTLWMASRDRARGTSALAWDRRTDSVRYVVPLPAAYRASMRGMGRYAAFHAMGVLTAWADTLLVGMRGRNELLVATADGRVVDTLDVPVSRRRGVPEDVQETIDDAKISARDLFRTASALDQVFRRADGSLVLVHHDADLEGQLPGGLITARVFVSIVSPDRRRACIDTELPVSQDARPIEGFRGDTLFLLDRRIVGEERVETRISSYLLDTSSCGWVPTR